MIHIIHVSKQPGLSMGDETVTQMEYGQWLAESPIEYMFGHPVEGSCQGIGPTREAALEALKKDRDSLYESMWY